MSRVLIFIWLCFLPIPALCADLVFLTNGDRLSGTIVEVESGVLRMVSPYAGEIQIQWEAVERVSAESPLRITLQDAELEAASVAAAEGRLEFQSATEGTVTAAGDALLAIRSQERQAAYEAETERLLHPGLLELWAGSFDGGLSAARGNSETLTLSLGMKAARATLKDRVSAYFTSLQAQSKTDEGTEKTETTANAIRSGARYEVNVADRLFTFGFADFEFDEFQDLDLRNVLGGALGYQLRRSESSRLDLFAGSSFNQEFFSNDLTRRSGEFLAGEDASFQLFDRLALTERLVFYPNLTELGKFRVTFDSTTTTRVNSWLSWQVTLSNRFLSNPAPGTKKNDFLLTTGVRISFGDERALTTGTRAASLMQIQRGSR